MSSSVDERIVVTGIGLASPNGNSLGEFRDSLLGGRSGVVAYETRYMGDVLAGVCDFDVLAHQGAAGKCDGEPGRARSQSIVLTRRWPTRDWIWMTGTSRGWGSTWASPSMAT
ncbi:MAG: hypothetical protein CM1200mP2_12200 [Planctomycetaceae bacterium]|nr:MAG: hypothetical protein CM1200mP2_12200 [Planctomycetaceae bacterium]